MSEQKSKKPVIKFILSILLLVGGVSGLIIVLGEKSNDIGKNETQQIETDETINELRTYDERTVAIAEYEMYYRDSFMYPKEAAAFHSLYGTIEKYALFYHLEQAGYDWDEEQRQLHENTARNAFEYDQTNPILKSYFEEMFETLNITEEDYLKYSVMVEKEFELKQNHMFEKHVGLDLDGSYPTSTSFSNYLKLIDMTEKQLDELAEKIPPFKVALDPQPSMPFPTDAYDMQVMKNEAGEYIFADVPVSLRYEERYYKMMNELEKEIGNLELSRLTIPYYQQALRNYTSNDVKQQTYAKELAAIFDVLDRTVNE